MQIARPQRDPTSRITGIIFVVLFHVGIIYALLNGLGQQAIQVLKQPLVTKVIDEIKPPDKPPPPPPPKLAPPPPDFIPPPTIQLNMAQPSATAITAVTHSAPPPVTAPIAAPKTESVKTAPVVTGSDCQKPDYPSVSRRLGEEGRVILLFLIDTNGRAIDSKIQESSGHPRLDEAARSALSLCNFKPGTTDGKPERSWATLSYKFQLDE